MNNKERIANRIRRDKIKKTRKRAITNSYADNFDNIIRYNNFYQAVNKCIKNVGWKSSVQKYYMNATTEVNNAIQTIKQNKLPKLTSNDKIEIYERGKQRTIVPITIRDRVIQRTICDESLIPIIKNKLIYDNCASLKGKGVEFTRDRVLYHLKSAINEYGTDFYILKFDFKKYFDSVPHSVCYDVLSSMITDTRITNLVMEIIKSYKKSDIAKIQDKNTQQIEIERLNKLEYRGICLGSQISQVLALLVPNKLDHYIKDTCRMKHYVRYNDDGIIFSDSKETLLELYEHMKEIIENRGLKFNDKKTVIVTAKHGFTFLKTKYNVTDTGKILKRLSRSGITRMRRKLKKLKKKYDIGEITLDNVYDSMQSWLAHTKYANAYKTRKSMLKLYNELFGGYKITKKYFKQQRRSIT